MPRVGPDPEGALERWRGIALLAYFLLGTLGVAVAMALDLNPIALAPGEAWVAFPPGYGQLFSALLGATLALAAVAATRMLVARWEWARALHAELRPAVHGVDEATLGLLALASALGEELFFRGLLVQVAGVVLSSLAFGVLHQVRGRARWAWAGWACIMGFGFAAIFKMTGSLGGAILAHFAVNWVNLRFLRDARVSAPDHRILKSTTQRMRTRTG
jgi:membrane protease YdiL (CAAX protease family)